MVKKANDAAKLASLFEAHGIPFDTPAFYNHPSFLAAERTNGAFLENYGAWVRARPRTSDYDKHVRKLAPLISQTVAREIARDGQLGTCVDATMMLSKMFEEEGIWCYGAKGALNIFNPALPDPTFFWMLDQTPVAGHVWLVAPPFEITDITLRTQPYQRGEAKLVPAWVIEEAPKPIVPKADEYVATSILQEVRRDLGSLPADIHFQLSPDLRRAAKAFPSWEVREGKTVLRYAAGGVTVSDSPSLHAIKSRTWNGMLAGEMYDRVVRPALAAA